MTATHVAEAVLSVGLVVWAGRWAWRLLVELEHTEGEIDRLRQNRRDRRW